MKRTKIERFFDGLAIAFGRVECNEVGYRITIVSADWQWRKKTLNIVKSAFPRCRIKQCTIFEQVSSDQNIVVFDGSTDYPDNSQAAVACRFNEFVFYNEKAFSEDAVFLYTVPVACEYKKQISKAINAIPNTDQIKLNLIEWNEVRHFIQSTCHEFHRTQ